MVRNIVILALVAFVMVQAAPKGEKDKDWNDFKKKHGKKYKDDADEDTRYDIFNKNKKIVVEHNEKFKKGEVSFTVGINWLSDLTDDEIAQLRGDNTPETSISKREAIPHIVKRQTRPPSVDWRTSGYVTPIKNQNPCGSCWAFSVVGLLEGQIYNKSQNLVSLSEQHLADCVTSDYGCNGCSGGNRFGALNYLKQNDIAINKDETYPYEKVVGTCRYNADNGVAKVTDIFAIKAGDENALQDAIATIGPIMIGMDASSVLFDKYVSGIFEPTGCSTTTTNHAMLAVGYGVDANGKEYYIVKNSWGTNWGEQGYIRVARNKNNVCAIALRAGYAFVEVVEEPIIWEPVY